ncbi:ABC transporter permease [Microbacterium sp. G2-8]|uniref:ABC transporter permease n=1 Tax=Microbacterium sp. G2-8 TaxID=2842454 RepID=UPI0021AA1A56|nr:ABC transporter permease [Microbacterium sp. G2-8]
MTDSRNDLKNPLEHPDADASRMDGIARSKPMSKWALYTKRFFRNIPAGIGLGIFVLLALFAIIGPLFQKYDHVELDFLALTEGPSSEHWFGTTAAGNDVFAMTIEGLRRSLMIALIVAVGTTVISAILGASAAYFGGRWERLILTLIHFMMAIPGFLIVALVTNGSSGNWFVLALMLILIGWMILARTVWTLSVSIREREFIQAARYMGVGGFRIVMRHMLPNMASLLVINFALGVVAAVQSETSLSFLGFGVKAPDVSLGTLIASGSSMVTSAPWIFAYPALMLTLLTVSMAFVADGLRDALDPNSAAGGRA